MNIHHVLDNLQIGGAETLVVALARLQQRDGHRVSVHGLYGAGPLTAKLQEAGIPLHFHGGGRYMPVMATSLAFQLWKNGAEVVHCHNIASTIAGIKAAGWAGISPVVSTRHGLLSRSGEREEKFWQAARSCHKVVAVSEAARKVLGAHPAADNGKLVAICNGADPANSDPEGQVAIPKLGVRFISVGRFTEEKDFPSLLRAFAIVRAAIPEAELWIVGDGAKRPEIEAVLKELGLQAAVRLVGMRKNVGFWFSQCDAFVLASVSEGLPMTLLEALAAGLPPVVTEVGGMPEVVQRCGVGSVVPPRDPEALAEAMIAMARDPGHLASLREAAKAGYTNGFTLRHMAEQYMKLYRGGSL